MKVSFGGARPGTIMDALGTRKVGELQSLKVGRLTVKDITKLLGFAPTTDRRDDPEFSYDSDKICVEWVLVTPDGVITIHDYKAPGEWSVGAKDAKVAAKYLGAHFAGWR